MTENSPTSQPERSLEEEIAWLEGLNVGIWATKQIVALQSSAEWDLSVEEDRQLDLLIQTVLKELEQKASDSEVLKIPQKRRQRQLKERVDSFQAVKSLKFVLTSVMPQEVFNYLLANGFVKKDSYVSYNVCELKKQIETAPNKEDYEPYDSTADDWLLSEGANSGEMVLIYHG